MQIEIFKIPQWHQQKNGDKKGNKVTLPGQVH
jgi:hypothetical protein